MGTQLGRAALWYARRGWHIFPLRPGTKEPFGKLGVYNATTDTDQVMDWWQRWPQANIGVHPGPSGFIGLDLDCYKDVFNGHGPLAQDDEETVTNLTGGGGTHLLYAAPEGVRYGNARGNLPPGIDVRAWGGYLVLPPSIHPNGQPYRWETGYGPHEIAMLPLPHSLRQVLDEARTHNRTVGPPDSRAVALSVAIVEAAIQRLDLDAEGPAAYDGTGRRWILRTCPFNPPDDPHGKDRGAFIIITRDGHISAGCHHERCRARLKGLKQGGWRFLIKEVAVAYAGQE